MISRRQFLKSSSAATSSLVLLGPRLLYAGPAAAPSTVIMVRNTKVIEQNNVVTSIVTSMMESGIKRVTGLSDLSAAWLSLFPGITPDSKILIKPSCLIDSFCTRFEIIQVVCESLMNLDLGGGNNIKKENICLYECTWDGQAGLNKAYGSSMNSLDITYNSADQAGFSLPITVNNHQHYMSQLVSWADYIINISIMKTHNDTCGITGLLKSHMGTISSSSSGYEIYSKTHQNSNDAKKCLNPIIGEIWAGQSSALIQKSVLNITDGIFASYDGTTFGSRPQSWQNFNNGSPSILLFSKDPVAIDTAHLALTNEERVLRGFKPFSLQPDPINFPDSSHILSVEAVGGGSTDYKLVIHDQNGIIRHTREILRPNARLSAITDPLHKRVKIHFYLSESSDVTLDILTIHGKLVTAIIRNRFMSPGFNQAIWSAEKDYLQAKAAGIYIARLKINRQAYFQRIHLL